MSSARELVAVEMADLLERMESAKLHLKRRIEENAAHPDTVIRLNGKIEGLDVSISYTTQTRDLLVASLPKDEL